MSISFDHCLLTPMAPSGSQLETHRAFFPALLSTEAVLHTQRLLLGHLAPLLPSTVAP